MKSPATGLDSGTAVSRDGNGAAKLVFFLRLVISLHPSLLFFLFWLFGFLFRFFAYEDPVQSPLTSC